MVNIIKIKSMSLETSYIFHSLFPLFLFLSIETFNEKYNLVAYDSDSNNTCDNELDDDYVINSLPLLPAISADLAESNMEKLQPIEINPIELTHKLTNVVGIKYIEIGLLTQ